MTDAALSQERKPLLRTDELPDFARNAINLASASLGARGVFATDEFFAPLVRMLQDSSPVFITQPSFRQYPVDLSPRNPGITNSPSSRMRAPSGKVSASSAGPSSGSPVR